MLDIVSGQLCPSHAGWVTEGAKLAQLALSFGADDLGSVLMEELVNSATGVAYSYNAEQIAQMIRSVGRVRRRARQLPTTFLRCFRPHGRHHQPRKQGGRLRSTLQSAKIAEMFDRIHARYDLLNHVLSGGLDFLAATGCARTGHSARRQGVLDLCCGTGDLSQEICKAGGGDRGRLRRQYAQPGRQKYPHLQFVQGDAPECWRPL
ncbi:MAG: class I SAM-dependent methyltransferase [Vulcanimicrobiota bacterium]